MEAVVQCQYCAPRRGEHEPCCPYHPTAKRERARQRTLPPDECAYGWVCPVCGDVLNPAAMRCDHRDLKIELPRFAVVQGRPRFSNQ